MAERRTGGGAAVVAVVVVALAVLALRPGHETIVVDDSPPIEPPSDGSAVVYGLRAPGGLAVFGLQIIEPTHSVEVQFLAGPGCSSVIEPGEEWPNQRPECAGAVEVAGTVAGLGVTDTGQSLVGVEFTVSAECFDDLERGMPWPPEVAGCGD